VLPIEPTNYHFMSKQLRRWSHGFLQNVRLHWRGVLHEPFPALDIMVAMWDASMASVVSLFILPLLVFFVSPIFLLGYLVDLPAVMVRCC